MNLVVKIARVSPGYYRAWCPALPGCSVYAQSETQANQKIAAAIRGYVASLEETLPRELATRWIRESAVRDAGVMPVTH